MKSSDRLRMDAQIAAEKIAREAKRRRPQPQLVPLSDDTKARVRALCGMLPLDGEEDQ